MKQVISILFLLSFTQANAFVRSPRMTEASVCTDCESTSRPNIVRNLRALKGQTERIFNATYFDDSNDRQSLVELRKKDRSKLTEEEKALLQASNRTGLLVVEGCGGGNAFIIQVDGQDAIITNKHLFASADGKLAPTCSLEKIQQGKFYPNASYIDPRKSNDSIKGLFDFVGLDSSKVINLEKSAKLDFKNDWMVIPLTRNISQEKALDGSVRGFIKYDNSNETRSNSYTMRSIEGYMIGFDPESYKSHGGQLSTFQKCDVYTNVTTVAHSCDAMDGSSGSLIGALRDGEIKFLGLHTSGKNEYSPAPTDFAETTNTAIQATEIDKQLTSSGFMLGK